MTTLVLGVIDIPYANGGESTGEVARALEKNYGVMDGFVELHMPFIAESMEDALKGALENVLAGSPVPSNPYSSGLDAIENRFRQFLDDEEITKLNRPGVPTLAAQMGISHRFKNPMLSSKNKRKGLKRNPPRQSFIDTGLYQANFKAWIK